MRPRPRWKKEQERKWARFDRACWVENPVATGELKPVKEKRRKKSKYLKHRRRANRKPKVPKKTVPVIDQKVRINKSKRAPCSTKAYKLWRLKILEQFKYTCLFCGSTQRIELDHIEPISKRPDLIMEDSNARALCRPCHETTPSFPQVFRAFPPKK